MHSPSPKATVWYSNEYMRNRQGMYTNEQLIEKAFNINSWMNRNWQNEWIQFVGKKIINELNALYTKDTIH